MTLEQSVAAAMRKCGNAFEYDCYKGEITVAPCGAVSPAPDCEWIWIQGSLKNDGLHHIFGNGDASPALHEETFVGKCWRLNPPQDFISIGEQISEFSQKITPASPVSESFGDYSYKNGTGANGAPVSWETAFADALYPYYGRRMVPGVFF